MALTNFLFLLPLAAIILNCQEPDVCIYREMPGGSMSNIWRPLDGQLKITNSQEGHTGFESLLSVVMLSC